VLENQMHMIVHILLPALVVADDGNDHSSLRDERLRDVEEDFMEQTEKPTTNRLGLFEYYPTSVEQVLKLAIWQRQECPCRRPDRGLGGLTVLSQHRGVHTCRI
jgi:hypothetical protein